MDFLSSFDIKPLSYQSILITVLAGLGAAVLTAKVFKGQTDDVDKLIKPHGSHWLWGHEREAWETPNSEWYIRNVEKHGLVVAMKGALRHRDILAISDPAALHHILAHSHLFVKGPFFRPFLQRLVGPGLVWAEGAEHTRQRQQVDPFFTTARVQDMNDDVQAATETFIAKLRLHTATNSDASLVGPVSVDVLSWLSCPTLDVIGKVCLGFDFGCGETIEARKIQGAWKELIANGMTFAGFIGPLLLRAFPCIGNLPFSVIQAQGVVKTIIEDFSTGIVDDMKQAGENDVKSRNDLLGKLIKTTDLHNESEVAVMFAQIATLVITGHATMTTVLAMTLLELARRKDIQVALREELMEFGGSGPGGQLTYDDLSNSTLPLLDAICKEGLRVWPVSSHAERFAREDDVIPLRFPLKTKSGDILNAIRVRKGQLFYIPARAINLNTRIWGADGHIFDPSRWIEPGRLPPPSSLTGGIDGHISFLEGPRQCVGYLLATFEFKVILSALIKNFEFETTPDTIQTIYAAALQPFVQGQKKVGAQLPLLIKPVVNYRGYPQAERFPRNSHSPQSCLV